MTLTTRSTCRIEVGESPLAVGPLAVARESLAARRETRDLSGLCGTRSALAERIIAGPMTVSGELVWEPSLAELARLLPLAMGTSTASGPGVTLCQLAERLPSFALAIDRGAAVFHYHDCQIAAARLTLESGAPATLALSIEALTEELAPAGSLSPTDYEPGAPLSLTDASVLLDGVAHEAARIDLQIENRMAVERFASGTWRVDLPVVERRVRLGLTLPYDAAAQAIYAAAPRAITASVRLAAGAEELRFDFPSVRFETPGPAIGMTAPLALELAGAVASTGAGELIVTYFH
jgi:hypothetical protein